jgi:pyruvate formate lyase activating enzyme
MINCNINSEYGYIHSIENCGTVDGPGLRYVIFCQGCLLRCMYCHNPDCFTMQTGKKMHIDEIIQDIRKYLPYIKNGGVTLSGGEPFVQADFTAELLRRIKQLGLHTAIDTSGYVSSQIAEKVLQHTDLVLLDIKAIDPDLFKKITGATIALTLEFAQYLKNINKPTWIRFVLVPGLTDSLDHIHKLAEYCTTLTNVARIEILPFHKLGEYKWQELKYTYQLQDTLEPISEQIQRVKKIFELYRLNIL